MRRYVPDPLFGGVHSDKEVLGGIVPESQVNNVGVIPFYDVLQRVTTGLERRTLAENKGGAEKGDSRASHPRSCLPDGRIPWTKKIPRLGI
jgi:hypothetical protein